MIENVIGIKWTMETIEQNWNFTVGIDTLNVRRSSSLSGEVVAVYGNGEVINYVATCEFIDGVNNCIFGSFE